MKTLSWSEGNVNSIANILLEGKTAVIPTDTLYGVLTLATNKEAVERVYGIKGRKPTKPFIILISEPQELRKFGIYPTKFQEEIISKYWPGTVSMVLPCEDAGYEYLHRGTKTLAFRVPADSLLNKLLKLTGPLIAPSTNPEGMEPALTIEEAKKYFGEKIDLYVDAGVKSAPPSTLISLIGDKLEVLRGELKK